MHKNTISLLSLFVELRMLLLFVAFARTIKFKIKNILNLLTHVFFFNILGKLTASYDDDKNSHKLFKIGKPLMLSCQAEKPEETKNIEW